MKKFLAAFCAVLILAPTLAFAQPAVVPHFSNGTTNVPGKVDADGILRVTEEYPYTNQYATTTVASIQPVFWCKYTTLQPFGTQWSAAAYPLRTLNFRTRRQPLATPSSALIYVYSSEDGSVFSPVLISNTANGNWANFGDSANVDTLKFLIPLRGIAANNYYSYSIPSNLYLGRFTQLYATKSDTTSGEVDSVVVSATWGGREQ